MIFDDHLLLGTEGASEASTPEFLLRCLLGARQQSELPSNHRGFDEDVNVYIVGLLGRLFSPAFHEETSRYLRTSDIDLYREVESSSDDRHVFTLYRVNADHLLVGIGLFRHVQGASHPGTPLAHREPEEFIQRGGAYYLMASSHLRRLRRHATGPEVAMRKLGDRFGDYVDVLRRVRSSYFHLVERIGEGSLYHLSRAGEGAAGETEQIGALYDAFLDAFSAWKAAPSPASLEALALATERLQREDPDFAFELPSEPSGGPDLSSA